MATSLVKYKDESFWMHDAVGEVFLSQLSATIESLPLRSEGLATLRNEILPALNYSWISGLLGSFFDEYLESDTDIEFLINTVSEFLRDAIASLDGDVVKFGDYQASKKLFLEELTALKSLLEEKGDFSGAPKIYSMTQEKWIPA